MARRASGGKPEQVAVVEVGVLVGTAGADSAFGVVVAVVGPEVFHLSQTGILSRRVVQRSEAARIISFAFRTGVPLAASQEASVQAQQSRVRRSLPRAKPRDSR